MKKLFSLLAAILVAGSVWATDYELVTSASQLVAGCNYIMADGTSSSVNVVSKESNTNNRKTTTATVANDKITLTDAMMVLQLGGSSNAWTFTTTNYAGTDGFFYNDDTSNNRLKVGNNTTTNKFTISFANNAISSITCNGNTSKGVMCFNGTLVACYASKSNSYKVPQLYKEVTGGAPTTKYTVTIDDEIEHGSISANITSAEEGATVTLTATPNKGYLFDSWTVLDGNENEVTVTNNQFTMPASDVEVSATFVAKPVDPNVIEFDFNDANAYPAGFPTSGSTKAAALTKTIGGHNIIINAPDAYYQINSSNNATRGLFFGKTTAANNKPTDGTAYLGFPAIPGKKLTKVVVTTTAGVAGSVKMNIYDASWNAYSTEVTTISSTKKAFTFNLSNTNGNTEYRLASGSSGKNLQFDNIVLTYVAANYTGSSINFAAQNAEGYWATYSNAKDVLIDGDALPYVVTAAGTTLTLNDEAFESMTVTAGSDGEVTGYFIPANTGILLYSTETEVFMWEVDNLNLAAISASNALYPASKDKSELANHKFYMLAYGDEAHTPSTLGFYYGAAEGVAFNSRANSAYLALDGAVAAPERFIFNQNPVATGVENATVIMATKALVNGQLVIVRNGAKFNLNGMLVK